MYDDILANQIKEWIENTLKTASREERIRMLEEANPDLEFIDFNASNGAIPLDKVGAWLYDNVNKQEYRLAA